MNDDEIKQIISSIRDRQRVARFDELAWIRRLRPMSMELAVHRLATAAEIERYLLPVHLDSAGDNGAAWSIAWSTVQEKFGRLGPTGDYGHPAINAAVYASRQAIRNLPADKAQWTFRDHYEAALDSKEPATAAQLDAGRPAYAGPQINRPRTGPQLLDVNAALPERTER